MNNPYREATKPQPTESPRESVPRRRAAQSEILKYFFSLLIVIGGLAAAWGLFQFRETNEKIDSADLIPSVEVTNLEPFAGEIDLEVAGTVVSFREIAVGSQLSGVILKKFPICEAGNFVKAGTTLLQIDPQDYELEVKTTEAEILQAQRTLEETDEEIRGAAKNLGFAKRDFELQQKEFRRSQRLRNSLAENELDQARRALLNSESQLTVRKNSYDMLLAKKERLKATLNLAERRLEKANLNLDRTVITAPVDGIIVRESVEQGDFVSVGRELLLFEDTSKAEVSCHLSPGELEWLRQHATSDKNSKTQLNDPYGIPKVAVQLFEKGRPNFQWHGTLERTDGFGLNQTTKSIPCSIVVNNPITESANVNRALVRGMYLKCQMILPANKESKKLVTLPAIAIRPGDFVWVVRNNMLDRFDVEVVDRSPHLSTESDEPKVVIDANRTQIKMDDNVVITPPPQSIAGRKVRIKGSNAKDATALQTGDSAKEPVAKKTSQPPAYSSGSSKQASKGELKERGRP